MKTFLALSLLTAAALPATVAHSEAGPFDSVQSLLSYCEASDQTRRTACISYIAGISSVMGVVCLENKQKGNVSVVAMGQSPSFGADMQAFTNWAKDNPAFWGEPALGGVMKALSTAFPCG